MCALCNNYESRLYDNAPTSPRLHTPLSHVVMLESTQTWSRWVVLDDSYVNFSGCISKTSQNA